MTEFEVRDLAIGYAQGRRGVRQVAENLNLRLREGQFTCLLGPNGVGKSTLLRTLAGLQRPLKGSVLLEGRPLETLLPRTLAQSLSLVLTERALVGTLPVWSLVAMGRYPYTGWSGRLGPQDESAVQNAIAAIGIEHLAFRPMSQLSDGERQKVMIARALAQTPRVMILDEATAFLDLPHRVELMQLLRELAIQRRCSILLSCHDLDLSLRHADYLWLLSSEGTMREGVPEDLVLSGGFEATFAKAPLSFDPWTGAFLPCRRPKGRVAVEGRGLTGLWTRRALERHGFEVVTEAAEWTIELTENPNGLPFWKIDGLRPAAGQGLGNLLEELDSKPA